MICRLSEMKKGDFGTISQLNNKGAIRRRLMEIGFISGTTVECICKSPLGDPTAYSVKGAVIALRAEDSSNILIECK